MTAQDLDPQKIYMKHYGPALLLVTIASLIAPIRSDAQSTQPPARSGPPQSVLVGAIRMVCAGEDLLYSGGIRKVTEPTQVTIFGVPLLFSPLSMVKITIDGDTTKYNIPFDKLRASCPGAGVASRSNPSADPAKGPTGKTPQQPPHTNPSLLEQMNAITDPNDAVLFFFSSVMVKCSRPGVSAQTYFFLDNVTDFRLALFEFRGPSQGGDLNLRFKETTTESDRANGYEWRGRAYMRPAIERGISAQSNYAAGWGKFTDGGGLMVLLDRKDGKWTFGMVGIISTEDPYHGAANEVDLETVVNEQLTCPVALSADPTKSFPARRAERKWYFGNP